MLFDDIWYTATPIIKQIHELPFLIELAKGFLAKEKFIHYLAQDALYLSDFSKALALTAIRLPDQRLMKQFMTFSQEALLAEQDLHLNYLKAHANDQQLLTEQTPACFMYTNYILKMASIATPEEAVASLLPCFCVYHEVGKKMAITGIDQSNPYYAWINLYTSNEFVLSVKTATDVFNRLSEATSDNVKNNMVKAFLCATKLEWLFWDSAYRQEKWLI